MNSVSGAARARLATGLIALSLLGLAGSPAGGQPEAVSGAGASPPARAPATAGPPARIEGTISVTISATRLKHWGVPGADVAFVPDADRSAYAERIRSAASARALCDALSAAGGRDRRIASMSVDGDADLNHRSGDEELLKFVLTVPDARPAARGSLYVCSHPVFAMMSDGAYPTERFHQIGDERSLWWTGYRLALRPGESVPARLTASVDASGW